MSKKTLKELKENNIFFNDVAVVPYQSEVIEFVMINKGDTQNFIMTKQGSKSLYERLGQALKIAEVEEAPKRPKANPTWKLPRSI